MQSNSVRTGDDSNGHLHGVSSRTGQTFVYFGGLMLLIYLATPVGYLVDVQTSFMLKNGLHATATQVSLFRLITAIPAYFAFVFGLARDTLNPFGLRDRGFLLIFAPVTAITFIVMAYSPISYAGLVAGIFVAVLAFRFIGAAGMGLTALIGQEKLMSGRLSAVWNVASVLPVFAGAFTSGYISDHLAPKDTFRLEAALCLLIAAWGFWKPAAVFSQAYEKPQARGTGFVGDIKRLVRHRAIYPAMLIMLLWSFAPGAATPLQFYLANTLHASDAIFSYYYGIFAVSFIPTFLLYGYLCKKTPLNRLLWWGTIVAVPQMIPLVFIHSANLALVLAAPIGLMGGVATAAYYDLAMRSCPPGLQGTLMMMVDGVLVLAQRGGDLIGSKIYNASPAHGFLYCVIATTAVYALILPAIFLIPRELIATADAQPNPQIESETLAEIA